MTFRMKDIEKWLKEDSAQGSTKQASASDTGALMEEMVDKFETEQFEKLANDSWLMGQIMGESFLYALEKRALAEVDDRIAGDIAESGQGEPPMMAQALEDKKAPQAFPSPVLEPLIQKLINKQVGEGASVSGADPREDGDQLMYVDGPEAGNVEGSDTVQKKVAAKRLLKELLRGR